MENSKESSENIDANLDDVLDSEEKTDDQVKEEGEIKKEIESKPDDVEAESKPDNIEIESKPDNIEVESKPDNIETENKPDNVEGESSKPDEVEGESSKPDEVEGENKPMEVGVDDEQSGSKSIDLDGEIINENQEIKSDTEESPTLDLANSPTLNSTSLKSPTLNSPSVKSPSQEEMENEDDMNEEDIELNSPLDNEESITQTRHSATPVPLVEEEVGVNLNRILSEQKSSLIIPPPPQLPSDDKVTVPKNPLTALLPVWSFGLNKNLPVLNLSNEDRNVICYAAANLAILYDYSINQQRVLQGHANNISCLCSSTDRRWLVTGDSGLQSCIIIWDTQSASIVRIMLEPYAFGVVGVSLTPDARYLAILSTPDGNNEQIFAVWDWTTGSDLPICSATLPSQEFGIQTYCYFNPVNYSFVMTNSDSRVIFYHWTDKDVEYYAPPLTDQDFNKPVGRFCQSIFQPNSTRALTATSQGLVVVWDTNKPEEKASKEQTADMKAVKLVPLHDRGINVILLTENFIVTGDTAGHIKFFDHNLMLIYWYQHINYGAINSLGFRYYPRPAVKDFDLNTTFPTDATIPQEKFVVRDFTVSTNNAIVVKMDASDGIVKIIMREFDSNVDALSAHPKLDRLAIGGRSGLLKVWNFNTMLTEVSRYFTKPSKITCCSYDPSALYIALGFNNGMIRILDACTLEDLLPEPIQYARVAITHVAFSHDSEFLATVDAGRTTTLLRAVHDDPRSVSWMFMGRYRAHTNTVVDIKFGRDTEKNVSQLMTLGFDRRLVEYDLVNSEKDHLKLLAVKKIEQICTPLLIVFYPSLGKEQFICTANDEYKLKLYNTTTKMCRQTLLGPTYGSPLRRMEVLPVLEGEPENERRYLCFVNDDKVGLIKLPATGNPHNNIAFVAHPSGISNMVCSNDGRFVFTAGGSDGVVHMWLVNREVLDVQASLAGTGADPFLELLGGRDGALFKELEDYFYYAQLRHQGINTMETRRVSTTIPLSEVPFVMRAMGFYPTEEAVEDILNEVKFSQYVETGQYVNEVDIGHFVQLYVNHRPPFGLSAKGIRDAFEVLAEKTKHGKTNFVDRDKLLHLLQTQGEHLMEYELAEYLTTLLGLNPEGGSIELIDFDPSTAGEDIERNMPSKLTSEHFIANILNLGPLEANEEGLRSDLTSLMADHTANSEATSEFSSQTE